MPKKTWLESFLILVQLFGTLYCIEKYAGFEDLMIGPFHVFFKNIGAQTEFYLTTPSNTLQVLSETNSWMALGFFKI